MKRNIRAYGVLASLGLLMVLVMLAATMTSAAPASGETSVARSSQQSPSSGHWVVVNSPNVGTGSNSLASVTGNAANDVTAVGSYADASFHTYTLIEHWNGSAWSVVTSPNPDPSVNRLNSVASDKSGGYWAAGSSFSTAYGALIERQTSPGGSWNLVPVPAISGYPSLVSISANSPTDAWAVGSYTPGSFKQTLVLHWNGTAWSTVTSPNPGTQHNYLTGVVAVNANNMWAVGYSLASGAFSPLSIHCDSTLTCTSVAVPNPYPGTIKLLGISGRLNGSSVELWASGFGSDGSGLHAVVMYGDGVGWSVNSPNQPYVLNGIYAPTGTVPGLGANSVIGVGDDETPGHTQIVPSSVASYTTQPAWTAYPPAVVGTATTLFLGAGGAPGDTVWAVGYSTIQSAEGGADRELVEINFTMIQQFVAGLAGTPTRTPPPASPTRTVRSSATPTEDPHDCITAIYTVFAVYAGQIVPYSREASNAVDVALGIADNRAAIQHFDGYLWEEDVISPTLAAPSQLNDVAINPGGGMDAVGSVTEGGTTNGIILHQTATGQPWVQVANLPNATLHGVAFSSANDGWAIGGVYAGGGTVLHSDGNGWALVSFPNFHDVTLFNQVIALSPNNVVVVGHYYSSLTQQLYPFAAYWDGNTWTELNVPYPGQVPADLDAISPGPLAPAGYYVGGNYTDGQGQTQPFMDVWNGTNLVPVSLPALNGEGSIQGMTTLSTTSEIVAVGVYTSPTGLTSPLALRGDALGFERFYPSSIGNYSRFTAVAYVSGGATGGTILTVGSYVDGGITEGFAGEIYCGEPDPPPALCPMSFTDVHASDYFYQPVNLLFCDEIISGYTTGCETGNPCFRPYNNTTRGQLAKIEVLGFALPIVTPTPGYTFADVLPSHTFYQYVETAYADGLVNGYPCGGTGEPCDPQHRPYFRPGNNITRGQLAKIDVVAAGWALFSPTTGSFEDVLPGSTFYQYVQTAHCHGIIQGYPCGGLGEPCIPPNNRPYFRQGNSAKRGQISKIVYLSLTGPPVSCTP